MKRIGVALNPLKTEATKLFCKMADWLIQQGVSVVLVDEAARIAGRPELGGTEQDVVGADVLVVLGGDGTMLHWARIAGSHGTPMLGVNFGTYGFITEIQPQDALEAVRRMLCGDYEISDRLVLKAQLVRNKEVTYTFYALNDVVVSMGGRARMLSLRTLINGKFIVTYWADGIVVSSPTGSTAYSLSAGGPVVHPDVGVLIITPICAHTLSERALVVPDHETVEITPSEESNGASAVITIDGQLGENIEPGDRILVSKAEYRVKLIQIEPDSFYNKLKTRLHWGERFT
jgi:NAD+ kinase